jgi:hypothetical protein
MTLMMTSCGVNGGYPDQDTNDTRASDGAGPAKRKKSNNSETSQDLQGANHELKAALAMVDDSTTGGAGATGLLLEEEEEGTSTEADVKSKGGRKVSPAKSRESRLQQNRKAARDSRKRKKEMIEELQRSLIFFSRSNAALKQQNDYLTRRLIEAQTTIAALQAQSPSQGSQQEQAMATTPQATTQPVVPPSPQVVYQQAAPTAVFVSSTGGPPAPTSPVLDYSNAFVPAMQPGSTMQAMANFQQAAAAAMQAAAQGMHQQHQQVAQQISHMAGEGPSMEDNKNGNTSQAPPRDSNNQTWL